MYLQGMSGADGRLRARVSRVDGQDDTGRYWVIGAPKKGPGGQATGILQDVSPRGRDRVQREVKRSRCFFVVLCLLVVHLQVPLREFLNGTKANYLETTKHDAIIDNTKSPISAPVRKASPAEHVESLELGWKSKPPDWLQELCPEICSHFTRFPSFKELIPPTLAFMTTDFAAHAVCTLKAAKAIAASTNAHLYLHAGSHLGAVVHGQPIPWDDDIDAFMDFRRVDDFLSICEDGVGIHEGVTVNCTKGPNAIKIWLQPKDAVKQTSRLAKHYSPFVDIFLYNTTTDGKIIEVSPNGNFQGPQYGNFQEHYLLQEYFPTIPYYFAGLYIFGPQKKLVETRYDMKKCVTPTWNHRLERPARGKPLILDCSVMGRKFPFVQDGGQDFISNGENTQAIFPSRGTIVNIATATTAKQRETWFMQTDDMGQDLTDGLVGLDHVDVDNSISPHKECKGSSLKIIEFNAERGRWWLEVSTLDEVRQADVIILNEMDIGMARSDQQHTVRQMAYFLGMNYAWGLEFLELTRGDESDRVFAPEHLPNFHGLHGNAFLTRCEISDAAIFRDKIGGYFSDKPSFVTANGLEKRLGGRMGLFGRIHINNSVVVVGAIHKLGEGGDNNHESEIKKYIGGSKAVVAGDQHLSFCGKIGLRAIIPADQKGFTWPASCKTFGIGRGDNICSNMKEEVQEKTTKPCVSDLGFRVTVSDHAFVSVTLDPM